MPLPTVLVVEDDPGILRLLEVSLELGGFSVLLAHDGAEGIEVARATVPDVVVSDVTMPRASGLELLAVLGGHDDTKDIPILLLSAERQAATPLGVGDLVGKPFEPHDLVDRVHALLHR